VVVKIKLSCASLLGCMALQPSLLHAQEVKLAPVVVTASKDTEPTNASVGAQAVDLSRLKPLQNLSSDTARLLQDVPGVSLYGAGGISSLPAIHGLADDRLRIQVDGLDLMAACPNHMNSTLSYIDPTKVGSVTVFAGITPVSVGGDSIGGSIQVKSLPPEFVRADEQAYAKGNLGLRGRSNGNATGYNVGATWVGSHINFSVSESASSSDNYVAGAAFKPATQGREGGPVIAGDVVASTSYKDAVNQDVALAIKHDRHLLQLNVGVQKVGFEGFPNQRMDMTANHNTIGSARYAGLYDWGDLEIKAYNQETRHKMDMGPDRYTYGTGMPMDTKAQTQGASVQANYFLEDEDLVRVGAEYQSYTLNDYWLPVGGTMGPNTFWNIDFGQRNKVDAFVEWEAHWGAQWLSQLGIRSNTVMTNSGPVQGYDNGLAALWGNDAAAFNALERQRTDHNWDVTLLARYTPSETQTLDVGYARKSRSPNLYQRYPWSTQAMAALMNNFVGDGNGYIGNVNLRPEVAHTLSASADWRAAEADTWSFKTTAYYTAIDDYIDVRRCTTGQCSAANASATSGFVLLQYVNQSAHLWGFDVSGSALLSKTAELGTFTGTALVNFVRGENRTTGEALYNIMPLNMKLAVVQNLERWTHTAEVQLVAAKTQVSQVRNEIPTGAYGLLNLRSSYATKRLRLDVALENALNQSYAMPLGGAYVGQGASMTTNGIAWGVQVPGPGRSLNVSANLSF
jgi:iron complex outermembrane recepter protein